MISARSSSSRPTSPTSELPVPYVTSQAAVEVSIELEERLNLGWEEEEVEEGTQRSAEPLSKSISNNCEGEPMPI